MVDCQLFLRVAELRGDFFVQRRKALYLVGELRDKPVQVLHELEVVLVVYLVRELRLRIGVEQLELRELCGNLSVINFLLEVQVGQVVRELVGDLLRF